MGHEVEKQPDTVELVVKFEVTEAAISQLAIESKDITFDTPKAYEAGRLQIAKLRDLRGAIEEKRVDLKAPALEFGRKVDAVAKHLTSLIKVIEDPLQAARKAVDEAAAKAKRDAERAELIALEEQQKKDREAAEAKAKAERDAEEARLAEQRKKLAEDQARIDEANKAIAEQQRLERERLDAEKAAVEVDKRKIADQQAANERAERERQDAARAEQAKIDAKRRADEETARLAEMRPDIEKVRGFAAEMRALAARAPKVTAEPCVKALAWICGHLGEVAEDLEAFDGK